MIWKGLRFNCSARSRTMIGGLREISVPVEGRDKFFRFWPEQPGGVSLRMLPVTLLAALKGLRWGAAALLRLLLRAVVGSPGFALVLLKAAASSLAALQADGFGGQNNKANLFADFWRGWGWWRRGGAGGAGGTGARRQQESLGRRVPQGRVPRLQALLESEPRARAPPERARGRRQRSESVAGCRRNGRRSRGDRGDGRLGVQLFHFGFDRHRCLRRRRGRRC